MGRDETREWLASRRHPITVASHRIASHHITCFPFYRLTNFGIFPISITKCKTSSLIDETCEPGVLLASEKEVLMNKVDRLPARESGMQYPRCACSPLSAQGGSESPSSSNLSPIEDRCQSYGWNQTGKKCLTKGMILILNNSGRSTVLRMNINDRISTSEAQRRTNTLANGGEIESRRILDGPRRRMRVPCSSATSGRNVAL